MSELPRFILIRGNSGAGKSTLAKTLRTQTGRKAALLEQDYLRRIVLAESGGEKGNRADNIFLIEQTAIFALERGYDVILEGILTHSIYGVMLARLLSYCPRHLVYYLGVPFEETLRRHATKPNAQDFGEREMRQWWLENDVTGFVGEKILPGDASLEENIATVLHDLACLSRNPQ